ncbi:sugar phosphate isomerase/epimerase [Propioniciclava coleopterorum]|uniref:Sugar phosphate isomerase/epimerase n=1 Tax=Propioniciclava coleopterorum TaxID=2714937 RepID=A0A6G7Y2I0_9ACTN|nr:sugar phosphate isomerase/epimerase family protein [Propioniciclava coleopterorum]QIK71084.1 sugar phosphate isomerase/epimerase [Propioniciclava coleopterorum]
MSANRLSLNTATTKYWTLAEAVAGAKAAGLEAVGLWRDRVAEVGLEEAARIVSEAGLRVSSLCRGGFLSAADEAGIAAALEDNRAAIREANALGTRELVMVVGGLPAASEPSGPAIPDGDKDIVAARQRVHDRIAELVPYAREHDVRLVLEPLHPIFAGDRAVLSTLEQCLDMAAEFDARDVGVVVDTYHVWWDPKLREMIARAGAEGRIASYQICDWILPLAPDALLSRGHVGDGYIDFPTITAWVAETGYDGDIEVEIFNADIWGTPGEQTVETMKERYASLVEPYL